MLLYKTLLFLHLLGAAVWTGGHLVLSIRILPHAWKHRDMSMIQAFESRYEGIGLPALALQVVTGLWLAYRYVPHLSDWWGWQNFLSTHIFAKLVLLGLTVILALHARFFLIPKEGNAHFGMLAAHIIGVTILSVLFVLVGVGFRTGGLW